MSLKREIALLAHEKGHKDLYLMIDVHLVGIYCLNGFLEGTHRVDAHERLCNALLDVMKHPSDNEKV